MSNPWDGAVISQVTYHFVTYPDHYAEVMDTAKRGYSFNEDDDRWYWESEQVYSDGMAWNTGSCIWFLPGAPTGAYHVRAGEYEEWRLVDPQHPRCWFCGRFFRREKSRKGRSTGPCWQCDEAGESW